MVEDVLPQKLREGVFSGEYCLADLFLVYLKTVVQVLLNLATYSKL